MSFATLSGFEVNNGRIRILWEGVRRRVLFRGEVGFDTEALGRRGVFLGGRFSMKGCGSREMRNARGGGFGVLVWEGRRAGWLGDGGSSGIGRWYENDGVGESDVDGCGDPEGVRFEAAQLPVTAPFENRADQP